MAARYLAKGRRADMTRLAMLAVSAIALAWSAFAAPTPTTPKLFLSPSGEPFRPSPSAPDPMKAWFDQADTKHQGYLDREEFRADAVRFFKRLDANGDGVIDGFEVADYEHKLVPELAAEAEGPAPQAPGEHPVSGGPRGRGHDGGDRSSTSAQDHDAQNRDTQAGRERTRGPSPRRIQQLIGEPEPVTGADYNFDTHITLDEWLRATDQRFEILDEHKDGKLTLEELRARLEPHSMTR